MPALACRESTPASPATRRLSTSSADISSENHSTTPSPDAAQARATFVPMVSARAVLPIAGLAPTITSSPPRSPTIASSSVARPVYVTDPCRPRGEGLDALSEGNAHVGLCSHRRRSTAAESLGHAAQGLGLEVVGRHRGVDALRGDPLRRLAEPADPRVRRDLAGVVRRVRGRQRHERREELDRLGGVVAPAAQSSATTLVASGGPAARGSRGSTPKTPVRRVVEVLGTHHLGARKELVGPGEHRREQRVPSRGPPAGQWVPRSTSARRAAAMAACRSRMICEGTSPLRQRLRRAVRARGQGHRRGHLRGAVLAVPVEGRATTRVPVRANTIAPQKVPAAHDGRRVRFDHPLRRATPREPSISSKVGYFLTCAVSCAATPLVMSRPSPARIARCWTQQAREAPRRS